MSGASPALPSVPPSLGSGRADPVPLSRVATGACRVVRVIAGPARAELEREGVHPGTTITVTARTPLGGPLLVDVGRARLALSADVATQVLTDPAPAGPLPPPEPGSR